MKSSGDRVIRRSGDQLLLGSLRQALALFLTALREIFDESAFERFLARRNTPRSPESYRAFLRERETSIICKTRCC